MNRTRTTAATLITLLGLALAAAPARAQEYVVEPIVDEPALSGESARFTEAELDQLLAPIALYPDALLSQVLIAATYPLEIVEAARWSRANPGLDGEAAVRAVAEEDWDPSVKSLVAFPDLLAQMDEDLEWTRQLGEAMLLQESDVMDSIQFLRAKADEAGSLQDTEQVRVVREERTIVIEPARERVVYVPYYDTRVVYGSWWYPAYPPVYWTRPPYYTYYGSTGFYWSSGIHVSTGFFYSDFYWPSRNVIIVSAPRYYYPPRHHYGKQRYYVPGERWKHDPWHRRSVKYRHHELRKRYEHRHDYRIRPPSAQRSVQQLERGAVQPRTAQRFAAPRQRQDQDASRQRAAPRSYRELESTIRSGRDVSRQESRVTRPQSSRPQQVAEGAARVERQLRADRSGSHRQAQSDRAPRQQAQPQRAQPPRQAAVTRQAGPSRQAAPPARQAQVRPPSAGSSSGNARNAKAPKASKAQASSSRGHAEGPNVRRGSPGAESRMRRQVN